MRYGSVCSGIEAATVAWHPLGFEPVWFSEIEAFPSAVLNHRFPNVPNLGDMTKIHETETFKNESIDLLVGGTPCQSFSIAGLRKGLDDPRGNLMLTYLAIAGRKCPRWVVWENVPGVLSSNEGRDFAAFLTGLAELGYGFAYRVLDAQYFGVAQRRRRVFVVGYFGDWRPAAAVLFERDSMSGNPSPRTKTREGIARGVEASVGSGIPDLARCIATREGSSQDFESTTMITHTFKVRGGKEGGGKGYLGQNEKAFTISTGKDQMVFDPNQITSKTNRSIPNPEICHTLPATANSPISFGTAIRRLTPTECERLQGFPDDWTNIPWRTWQEAKRKGDSYEGILHSRGMNLRGPSREDCPDGPRYKACGNSMAVPVMRWIGERIQMVESVLLDRTK